MKRVIIACFALMMAVGVNAQNHFQQGDWIIGAQTTSLNLENNFNKPNYDIEFNFSALGGWFFADKLAVDLMGGIDYQKSIQRNQDNLQQTSRSCAVGFGTGVRYYPVANLFVRVGYNGLVWNNSDLISYLDAKVGYDIFLSEKIFFEPAVYYAINLRDNGMGGRENVLGLSLGFGVKF